jgi:hypothetical protein
MDSSVSPKDEIWFLHVCHHISNAIYSCTIHTREGSATLTEFRWWVSLCFLWGNTSTDRTLINGDCKRTRYFGGKERNINWTRRGKGPPVSHSSSGVTMSDGGCFPSGCSWRCSFLHAGTNKWIRCAYPHVTAQTPLNGLTFWRRNYFFLILAYTVYKMLII